MIARYVIQDGDGSFLRTQTAAPTKQIASTHIIPMMLQTSDGFVYIVQNDVNPLQMMNTPQGAKTFKNMGSMFILMREPGEKTVRGLLSR